MEAYANEDKSDYEINTNKYKIKNRKKTYRENKKNWFNYIKKFIIMACGGKKGGKKSSKSGKKSK